MFTGGCYIAAIIGDPGNYIKGVYDIWFGSSLPVDETAVIAKLQTSLNVLPVHITADLLPNNVISDLQISIGDHLRDVPMIPLIWTTLQLNKRFYQQPTQQQSNNNNEETTVESQIYLQQIQDLNDNMTVDETNSSHNSNENLSLDTESSERETLEMTDDTLDMIEKVLNLSNNIGGM